MKTIQNLIKYAMYVGIFAIPFIPFIVPSDMFFPFISGKGFTFRILVEIVAGLFVILAFLDSQYRPKLSWITKAVLLFTGAVLVADLLGVNVSKSLWSNYERMEGFVLIAHLALYYIVTSSVLDVKKWFYYLNTSIGASVIMACYGFLQLAGKITINQGGVRLDGTFGNSTYFAIYAVFHIFLSLYFLIDWSRPQWQKWFYGSAVFLNLIILYYTATRGAILGLIGGLVLSGLIVVFKEKENVKLRKVIYWIFGIMAVLVLGFIMIRNTDFVRKSQVLSRFASLNPSEIKTQGRYYVWPMAIKGFIEHPVFGYGQEGFNYVFNKYYDPKMYNQEQWFDRTHDIFLDWLIAGGLVGFISYLSLYAALLCYIWRRQSPLKVLEQSILTGLLAAYVFHNIFVFDNLISYILFFSVLAFVHTTSRGTDGDKPLSSFYTKTFSSDAIYYVVSPVVLISTVIIVYYVNFPALLANQTLIKAMTPQGDIEKNFQLFKQVYSYNSFGNAEATEQLVQVATQLSASPNVPENVKIEFYNLAKEKIEEKLAETPRDTRYLVFAGSFFNRFSKYDEAISYLNRAIAESPKKQPIYAELASSYMGKGDLNKMFELLKKSYELEPASEEARIMYAIGAIYTKNTEVLKQLASKISSDTIMNDNRFLQTYAAIGDYNSVIAILNARIQKDPTNMQYRLSLASALATAGRKQEAINVISEMIKQDPSFKDQGSQYIKQIQSM